MVCTPALQRSCIGWLQEAAARQRLLLIAVGSSASHLHTLVAWHGTREAERVRAAMKRSVSAGLRRERGDGAGGGSLFSKGGDCFRIQSRRKYRFQRFAYLPDHPGWFWDIDRGLRPPAEGQRLVERWRLGESVERGAFVPVERARGLREGA
ncbi:hypothetical protein [Phycisphaera mikurensis]|uniref:hypothetical protein n=1 Tax=Phycisphaera mikurensis TaxID=547188 RepID=UPI0012B5EFC8|nr:hypothetical protein [Phycisphaera mikurensis]MBB6441785.1 hypothetical protein [Phycisphaera mikurensis]